jgi:AcrR family transcriptional regulator
MAATNSSRPEPAGAPDVRREQMLEAAAAVMGERGFSETRIADVARRCDASPALVIYYFGTKDRLLTEALRWSEDRFYSVCTDELGALPTARARLELLVHRTCIPEVGAGEAAGGWGLWFDLWAQALRHPEVAKDRIELDQRWRRTIVEVVEHGRETGELGDVDAQAFAVTFAALLDGLSIQVALLDPEIDPGKAFRIAMGFASDCLDVDWRAPRTRAARRRKAVRAAR